MCVWVLCDDDKGAPQTHTITPARESSQRVNSMHPHTYTHIFIYRIVVHSLLMASSYVVYVNAYTYTAKCANSTMQLYMRVVGIPINWILGIDDFLEFRFYGSRLGWFRTKMKLVANCESLGNYTYFGRSSFKIHRRYSHTQRERKTGQRPFAAETHWWLTDDDVVLRNGWVWWWFLKKGDEDFFFLVHV